MHKTFKLVGKKLFEEGLISSHSGNLSVKDGDKIFISKTGAMLSELADDDIIETTLAENAAADEAASMELVVHRSLYQKTDAQAIVHAHPKAAVALSIIEDRIQPQDAEGCHYMKTIPVVRVRNSVASTEVARVLPQIINGYKVAVIKGHGSFVIAKDLIEAYKLTSVMAASCAIAMLLKSAAKPPQRFDDNRHRGRHQQQQHRHNQRKGAIPHGIGIMGRRVDYNKR